MQPRPSLSNDLRKTMRKRRRGLSNHTLTEHATAIAQHLGSWLNHKRPRNIASYQAYAGEVPTDAVRHIRAVSQCQFYYPAIHNGSMRFFADNGHWQKNKLGILEPARRGRPPAQVKQMDMVLVPLVAFDRFGNRLGQGGGYYDRCFAFKRQQRVYMKPLLVGFAHQFQQVEQLPTQPWDVRLDLIVTEAGIITPIAQQ